MDVLFIGHDASRTGAPIIFLNQLEWITKNTNLTFEIILKEGGQIEKEYNGVKKTFIWNRKKKISFLKKLFLGKFKQKYSDKNQIIKILNKDNPRIIYSNTVVSSDLGDFFAKKYNAIHVCHIHELEIAINKYFGKAKFTKVKKNIDYFLAVSENVKKNLINTHQIEDKKIKIFQGFVKAKLISQTIRSKSILKSEININEDDIVIGGCGTLEWRKSPDIFILIAKSIQKLVPLKKIVFVWVGGDLLSDEYKQLIYDCKNLGVKNIHFLGNKKNPLDYFKGFDIFILSSREDPFPLVCLEAASLGMPLIAFDKSGGIKEFIQDECGFIIPYLDINKATESTIKLINDKELRNIKGKNAQEKALQFNDVSYGSNLIYKFLKNIIYEKKTSSNSNISSSISSNKRE